MQKTSTTSENDTLKDIPQLRHALDLFLTSQMLESEEFCRKIDPSMERLYPAAGLGLIQCIKALMSHEHKDLLEGMEHAKHGNVVADKHRKKSNQPTTRFFDKLLEGLSSPGLEWYKSMTPTERHAELIYAETLYEKALLSVVDSGNWLAFLKEAPDFNTVIAIYRQLEAFVNSMDAEARARGKPEDESIGADFRSGVHLGAGCTHIILSMLPGNVVKVAGFLGYKGDRKTGLEYLQKNGGWSSDPKKPPIPKELEGIRRPLSDMFLLIFHLVYSEFTFNGVDLDMAQRIIDWNLKRYPNGIFFLFAQGRMNFVRNQPTKAIEFHKRAAETKHEYKNLKLISYWEMALANLALWDIPQSLESWVRLRAGGSWSKATYAYGVAICTLHLHEEKKGEISTILEEVPGLQRGVAGISIPLEELTVKRARRFKKQGGRLCLAALEFAYALGVIAHTPRDVVANKMLPQTKAELDKLNAYQNKPESWGNGKGYWDDYCLCRFLEGVCERYLAYQGPAAVSTDDAKDRPGHEARAKAAFEAVLLNGKKIRKDHHLVFHTHYEYGRLFACQGKKDEASKHFKYVSAGKAPESNPKGWRGKYYLEDTLNIKTHAANEALAVGHRL